MTTNEMNFIKLNNAKGYFCEWCQEYHEEPRYRLIVEFIGEYCGQDVRVESQEILCPECKRDDMAEFNPNEWTPLLAYLEKNPMAITFRYPVYKDMENDTFPTSIEETEENEVVVKAAGKYCIEIIDMIYDKERDTIFVDVEIC
jgi:hypothetical protein